MVGGGAERRGVCAATKRSMAAALVSQRPARRAASRRTISPEGRRTPSCTQRHRQLVDTGRPWRADGRRRAAWASDKPKPAAISVRI